MGGPTFTGSPSASFSYPATGIVNQAVSFTDQSTSGPTGWDWNWGDSTTHGTTKNPSHTYTSTGTKTVTLTASNPAGSNAISHTITINPLPPVAAFGFQPATGTVGVAVSPVDQSTGSPTAWDWNWGDGTAHSTTKNPSHTYTSSGSKTVTLIASNAGGSSSPVSRTITINPAPVAPTANFQFSPASGATTGQAVYFTDLSTVTPTSWSWNFGDGGTSTIQNPNHVFSSAGSKTVTLVATNGVGSSPAIAKQVSISAAAVPPVANFAADVTSGVAPLTVHFNDLSTGSISGWSWNFGDGSGPAETGTSPSHVYNNPGTYTVVMSVTGSAGSNSNTKNSFITVSAPTPTPGGQVNATPSPGSSPTPTVVASPEPTPVNNSTGVAGVTSTPVPSPSTGGQDSGTGSLLPFVAGGVVVVAVVGLVAFLFTRQNLRAVPKSASVPCFGGSTNLQIGLFNGLGKHRTALRNTDVELSTTSGTIPGSIVLPKGQDQVDVPLVAGSEAGPVTVTAKVGNRTATATVNFVPGLLSIAMSVTPDSLPADGRTTAGIGIRLKDEKGRVVSMQGEQTVTLATTIGTITSPVKIPAKAEAGNAVLTAGTTIGWAIVTATSGALKGEVKVEMASTFSRFCMHCGAAMSPDDPACKKCGQTPPSGTDVKECPNCGTVIPEAAMFCYKCGAHQPAAGAPIPAGRQPASR